VLPLQPVVPLVKVDEFVLDTCWAVLGEHFINRSSEPFGIVVRAALLVVQQYPGVVVLAMQWFEMSDVVRQQDDIVLRTPLQQFGIFGVLSEPVFGLFDIVSPLAEHALEDATDMLVKENPWGRH